jgi:hypothetical protein
MQTNDLDLVCVVRSVAVAPAFGIGGAGRHFVTVPDPACLRWRGKYGDGKSRCGGSSNSESPQAAQIILLY